LKSLGYYKYRFGRFATACKFYTYNSFVTNLPGYGLRTFYLRHVLKIKIGKGTAIHMGCLFMGRNIEIGNNTVINRSCRFDGRVGKIEIKNNVSLSVESYLLTESHLPNDPNFKSVSGGITINDYAWIGLRSIIMPGVTIGVGSIVGAASTATKSIGDYKIAVGSPAKVIGERNKELDYTLSYFPFFNTDIF